MKTGLRSIWYCSSVALISPISVPSSRAYILLIVTVFLSDWLSSNSWYCDNLLGAVTLTILDNGDNGSIRIIIRSWEKSCQSRAQFVLISWSQWTSVRPRKIWYIMIVVCSLVGSKLIDDFKQLKLIATSILFVHSLYSATNLNIIKWHSMPKLWIIG